MGSAFGICLVRRIVFVHGDVINTDIAPVFGIVASVVEKLPEIKYETSTPNRLFKHKVSAGIKVTQNM